MNKKLLTKESELQHHKKIINSELNKIQKKKREHYIKKNKWFLRFLDVLVVLILLSNTGALLITNAMVVKEDPSHEFREANPVTAERGDYEIHPEARSILFMFVFQAAFWFVLTFAYIWYRRKLSSDYHLWILTFIVLWYFMVLFTDFINDLGFWIGRLIFGG